MIRSFRLILNLTILVSVLGVSLAAENKKEHPATTMLKIAGVLEHGIGDVLDKETADYNAIKCAVSWMALKSIDIHLKKQKEFSIQDKKYIDKAVAIVKKVLEKYEKSASINYFNSQALKASHAIGKMIFRKEKSFRHDIFLIEIAEVKTSAMEAAVVRLDPKNMDVLSAPLYAEIVDAEISWILLVKEYVPDLDEMPVADKSSFDKREKQANALFNSYSKDLEAHQWYGSEHLKKVCEKWNQIRK